MNKLVAELSGAKGVQRSTIGKKIWYYPSEKIWESRDRTPTNRPHHRHTNAKFRVACGEGFLARKRMGTRVLWLSMGLLSRIQDPGLTNTLPKCKDICDWVDFLVFLVQSHNPSTCSMYSLGCNIHKEKGMEFLVLWSVLCDTGISWFEGQILGDKSYTKLL